jgi:hypothetical protein
MTTNAVLLVILSLLVAGGLSFFQYYYKAKKQIETDFVLAFDLYLFLCAAIAYQSCNQ